MKRYMNASLLYAKSKNSAILSFAERAILPPSGENGFLSAV